MGNSAKDSVVNKHNQSWDIPNLFIADGSALTTGGSVSPTNAIQALTVRCAEYIKRNYHAILEQRRTPSNQNAPSL